jgi:cell filamentation protein
VPRGHPQISCYPGTDVLVNHFGIRDQRELEILERVIVTDALAQLQERPIAGRFDVFHLSAMHERLFGKIYPFAGEFRTEDIRKWSDDTQAFSHFVPAELVVPWLSRTLREAEQKRHFRDMPAERFVENVTQLYRDLNAFHPFREGNGRTNREFIRTMGLKAGYEIDWDRLEEKQLLRATVRAAFDKADTSLRDQLALALVNQKPDRAMQREYDRRARGLSR